MDQICPKQWITIVEIGLCWIKPIMIVMKLTKLAQITPNGLRLSKLIAIYLTLKCRKIVQKNSNLSRQAQNFPHKLKPVQFPSTSFFV